MSFRSRGAEGSSYLLPSDNSEQRVDVKTASCASSMMIVSYPGENFGSRWIWASRIPSVRPSIVCWASFRR